MKNNIISILVLLTIVSSACTGLNKNYPIRNFYSLKPIETDVITFAQINKVLEVSTFTISPKYRGKEFIYKIDENRFDSDFYNQFFNSPAQIITVETLNRLNQSNIFKNIINSHTPVHPDYVLYGNIVEIFGDFSNITPQSVLSVEFILVDESSIDSKILFNKVYSDRMDLNSKSAKELVNGWNILLTNILNNFEKDLVNIFSLDSDEI